MFLKIILLKQKLQSVQDALPDCSEVIVVNDGPAFEQPTRDLIATLGAVSVKTKGGLGAGAARNIGADHARGQWLLFLDDDDLIAVGYWQAVARYIDAHLQTATLAYGFCQASPQSDRAKMQRVAAARTSFHIQPHETAPLKPKLAGLGVGFWMSKALFQMVGGINTELRTNEDTDFCLKLLSAGARCHHTPSHGAVIFQGDHGTAAASSTTKRYGPAQRARYFKHIIDNRHPSGNPPHRQKGRGMALEAISQDRRTQRRNGRLPPSAHSKGINGESKASAGDLLGRLANFGELGPALSAQIPCSTTGPTAWSKAATLYLLRRRSGKTGAQDPNRMRPSVYRAVRSKFFTL